MRKAKKINPLSNVRKRLGRGVVKTAWIRGFLTPQSLDQRILGATGWALSESALRELRKRDASVVIVAWLPHGEEEFAQAKFETFALEELMQEAA